jgi:hypothetical protein
MYVEDGFSNIEEFAESTYKISRSTAYRLMEINTEFSKNGNSPELADEYKDFSKSQLQELLSLTIEQRETVTPDMTVSEIRNIKKEKESPPKQVIKELDKETQLQNDYELGEVLEGQLEITNVDMEVQEVFNSVLPDDEQEEELEKQEDKPEVMDISYKEAIEEDTKEEKNSTLIKNDVINILTFSKNNVTECIPFSSEDEMFIFGDGEKCAMTMKLQKYIAKQVNLVDLSEYRLEVRAVKI